MNNWMLLAGSDQPSLLHDNAPRPSIDPYIRGWGHQVFGCCGARLVKTVEEFNNNTEMTMDWNTITYDPQFNRGILLALNLDASKVKQYEGTVVEQIKCGQDTIFLRIRTQDNPPYRQNENGTPVQNS